MDGFEPGPRARSAASAVDEVRERVMNQCACHQREWYRAAPVAKGETELDAVSAPRLASAVVSREFAWLTPWSRAP